MPRLPLALGHPLAHVRTRAVLLGLVVSVHAWLLHAPAPQAQHRSPPPPVLTLQLLPPVPPPLLPTVLALPKPTPLTRTHRAQAPTVPRPSNLLPKPAPEPPPRSPAAQAPDAGLARSDLPETPSPAPNALPPPRYPVTLPPAVALRYDLRQGPHSGHGELLWQPEASGTYTLQQRSQLASRPAMAWHSQGMLDADGIAPVRWVESRHERARSAVNFQRDKHMVSASSSSASAPLVAVLQDRASWLVQLAGIVQARRGQIVVGESITLGVVPMHVTPELWHFEAAPDPEPDAPTAVAVAAAASRTAAAPGLLYVRREASRPYDVRIELWLDAGLHYLPRRMRWQVLPGGEPMQWELASP